MKVQWKTVVAALLAAGALTLLVKLGALTRPDQTASDVFYQDRQAFEGDIVLVGIDQRAMDAFGPCSEWGRDVIAMALEALNSSEDCRPAVIALDILYTGEKDSDLDLWLAEAAGQYGNVIAACAAQFGGAAVEGEDGELYWEVGYEEPYAAHPQGNAVRRRAGDHGRACVHHGEVALTDPLLQGAVSCASMGVVPPRAA